MTGRREGAVTRWLLGFVAGETLLAVAIAATGIAAAGAPETRSERAANRHLVAELRLTDLALWSGPSYCRHPSQTDLFAPFADHPGAFEHFPAGSLVPPPAPGDAAAGREGF